MRSPRTTLAFLSLLVALVGCEPKFEPSGSLTIDGAPFQPTLCQVLAGETGIELTDAAGARLKLTLPPVTLEAFREIGGTPSATFEASGKAVVTSASCGTLKLRGEGYHGSGKRAASGALSLSCTGPLTATGTLSFTGCF
jgi:hypothetical protein